jgi:luciferase family oxidoreductase group 1
VGVGKDTALFCYNRHAMVKLSVLDQSPIRDGGTPEQAVQETLALAEAAERLGYHRYWLAEHHSSDGLACASPEVLIPVVAARTRHMRVGSGGVMLTHYSPLKVAEQFRMLEALFPGRIDLGLGRAPGSDQRTAAALAHGPGSLPVSTYPSQVADLVRFMADEVPDESPFHGVRAMPSGKALPELWLLGSAIDSALLAAELGCAFSFAHFITPQGGPDVAALYRNSFKPSAALPAPKLSVGISVLCAETEERAEQLAWSLYLWRLQRYTGERRGVPSVEEALKYPYTPAQLAFIKSMTGRAVRGNPQQVKRQVLDLAKAYGTDEFVVVTICHDFRERLRSYELLAEAFDLPPRSAVSVMAPALRQQ